MAIEGQLGSASGRRLRLGMVGGGQGAFIGAVHRIAARLDDRFELVAGALSSDPERARASAAELHIAPDRAYARFAEMAEAEAKRSDGIDVVAIVTPNHMHAAPARLRREEDPCDLRQAAHASPGGRADACRHSPAIRHRLRPDA